MGSRGGGITTGVCSEPLMFAMVIDRLTERATRVGGGEPGEEARCGEKMNVGMKQNARELQPVKFKYLESNT